GLLHQQDRRDGPGPGLRPPGCPCTRGRDDHRERSRERHDRHRRAGIAMSAGLARPSILLVDGDATPAELVAALPEESGMSTRRVSSGQQALQALEEEYFDLVLSDVKMPEMDGLELLERMRADYPEIPVVLLTGFGTVEMAVAAMRAGAASFVV